MANVRWGFIGTGRLIPRFMDGFRQVPDAIPAAIYGRKLEKAKELQERFGIEAAYDDLDEMLEKANLDVVHIAVTHPVHLQYAKICIEHGVAVLCEKPMTPCLAESEEMVSLAREKGVFLMEGLWTRTFPITRQIMDWIRDKRIGEVASMNGVFSIKTYPDSKDRLYDPAQAGGALLDIGIYLVAFADMVFGRKPEAITSLAHIGEYGVEDSAGMVFRYDRGELATMLLSFNSEGKDKLTIYGTDGIIEIDEDFWRPRHALMTNRDGMLDFNCPVPAADTSVYGNQVSFSGEGYQFEVEHVNDCIRKGLKESPLVPMQASLNIIAICDEIRRQNGIVFPCDAK